MESHSCNILYELAEGSENVVLVLASGFHGKPEVSERQ